MPRYYKKRTYAKKNEDSFKFDWKLILIGVFLFLVYRLFTSKKGGNKATLSDWLKGLLNLNFGFGSGNNPLGNSDYGSENGSGNDPGSIDNGTTQNGGNGSSIKESKYFKPKEYFGNYPRPTDPLIIANYNRLAKSLDNIRAEFGSPVLIGSGYSPNGERLAYKICKGVSIYAQNGDNKRLYDVASALKKSNKIEAGTLYYFENTGLQYLIN